MMKVLKKGSLSRCAGRGLVVAVIAIVATSCAQAQHGPGLGSDHARPVKEHALPGGYPANPSVPPSSSIPVEPLGFSAPGPLYLGQRVSVASLDFIGENRLLFTFRVPGLIQREFKNGESEHSDERRIKALVLTLPTGAIESESLWTVHDHARYLWMLKDGQYLFRDKESLLEGNAKLELKPLLQFPGSLLRLELDPGEQFLVTNSMEPAATPAKPGSVGSPPTAAATVTTDDQGGESQTDAGQDDYVVRILRRDSGKVMLVSRTRAVVHLPINSEGYIENLRGRGDEWVLNLNFFTGGSHILGSVNSSCVPNNEFVSPELIAVAGCDSSGAGKLLAVTTDGKILWDDLNPATAIWPLLIHSPDGLRVAQETLAVTHAVGAFAPLGNDDIKGQVVRVLDGATGDVVFESPVSPVLDAGGNVAISPSGRRVAVINAGAIQVFDLPAPTPLPSTPKP
ncbi:MAG TPA: hypothetical protein VH308_00245 [Terracidiphilus sp.]|nr:hypothetical protein [Terracidiphilus sp.]